MLSCSPYAELLKENADGRRTQTDRNFTIHPRRRITQGYLYQPEPIQEVVLQMADAVSDRQTGLVQRTIAGSQNKALGDRQRVKRAHPFDQEAPGECPLRPDWCLSHQMGAQEAGVAISFGQYDKPGAET